MGRQPKNNQQGPPKENKRKKDRKNKQSSAKGAYRYDIVCDLIFDISVEAATGNPGGRDMKK